ncbi:MAG: hypothetical protein ACYTHJ_23125 [Planctomycetota bacterium]|jgi:hypothetical protein
MQCPNCEYLLFNLTQPVCPECGQGFRVDDFRFKLGTVSFQCPTCDQAYYGNDSHGLPYPRQFNCVRCGEAVHVNNMRVVPLAADTSEISQDTTPWSQRKKIGFWKAWWKTVGMTMTQQRQFFSAQQDHSLREAWIFATTTYYVGYALAMLFAYPLMFLLMKLFGAAAGGGGITFGPGVAGITGASLSLMINILYVVLLPPVLPWLVGGMQALTTQLGLLVLARERKNLHTTLRVAMYSAGPYALYAVPLCGGHIGGIWAIVTYVLGVMTVHRISGGRAALAVLWPILAFTFLGIAAALVLLIV